MRVLVLGGTGDARRLAAGLHAAGLAVTYSVADPAGAPAVPCAVRRGGFGGSGGLTDYLRRAPIGHLVDATHPYATGISRSARIAASAAGIPLWAMRRPPWQAGDGDDWTWLAPGATPAEAAAGWRRPLFTIGPGPLDAGPVPHGQHWLVRCLPGHGRRIPARCTVLAERGPFALGHERAVFDRHRPDGLITRDSGGAAVSAKLTVARERGIPVRLEPRPEPPPADRAFTDPRALVRALAPHLAPGTADALIEASRPPFARITDDPC